MQTSLFVEDWLCFNNTLGEGAYGEVKLLINRKTEQKVACKIINHKKYKDAQTEILREVTIHKGLKHDNIIMYLGRRQEPTEEYIFLEYAAGGELFQLIEPDIGMPSRAAQTYMKHLLCGMSYLHMRGIAHRDIKPENLLIDDAGVLKISDFGMATIFRAKGKERLLDKKCGTKPYLAPEVLLKPYRAQPADLWSCGIVFVAMLTGELPWSQPSDRVEEFLKWKKDVYISETPWSKLGNTALSLARQILNVEPKSRLKLEQIEKHPWMKFDFSPENGIRNGDGTDGRSSLRWHSLVEAETRHVADTPDVIQSQPLPSIRPAFIEQLLTSRPEQFFFSQPTQNDNLMLQFTQTPVTKESFGNLIKRMTRFYVTVAYERALEIICNMLDTHHYNWSADGQGIVTVNTVDRMKNQLTFKVNILEMDSKILIDFRLYKGCGLEFKKKFLKLKSYLVDIVDNN